MKLGLITSAGGSAFAQIAAITRDCGVQFTVITDRPCGAEQVAINEGAALVRIEERNRVAFSQKAAAVSRDLGLKSVLLMFDRLVSKDLFDEIDTVNIHPAALPSFKGLRGVEDAYSSRVRILGCTLHEVDETIDGGKILAQIASGADPAWSIDQWQKRAYLMKIYCGLVWISQFYCEANYRVPVNASHGIRPSWLEKFLILQEAEGQKVLAV